jgi:integrase
LTPEQVAAFLGKATEQKYCTRFMLSIFAGARQGELLGLKWPDVDRENNQIHIQRTFNKARFFATNHEAACRLENSLFGATGHNLVTKTKKGVRPTAITP